jgi:hypothetical protein
MQGQHFDTMLAMREVGTLKPERVIHQCVGRLKMDFS